jgi:hypothetical protein
MSFPGGDDRYGGGQRYNDQYAVSMSGTRLTENFGEYSYAPAETDMSERMMDDSSYAPVEESRHHEEDRWQERVPEMEHQVHVLPVQESGSFTEYSEMPEEAEAYGYGVEEAPAAASAAEAAGTYSPPLGYWDPSSDFATQEYAIKRMIKNKNNMFDMFSHIEYRLAEGSRTKWNLASEWGKDGKNTPYGYSGSPFGANRVISRIWLMEASHNGSTSQSLHFSMPNSLTKTEMLKPLIPMLVKTHEEGPTHVILRPGEKLRAPMLLWYRDVASRRSPVIAANPGVTADKLRSELMDTSNMKERGYVKNLAAGNSTLLDYIRDKIDYEGYVDRLDYVPKEGYYKIPVSEAETFINLWKSDQSRDLTVGHLYNLTVRPNRAVRSPKESPSFHEDAFQDKAEIMSRMSEWSFGDAAEEKSFYNKTVREKPVTLYWTVRVELVPGAHERHERH